MYEDSMNSPHMSYPPPPANGDVTNQEKKQSAHCHLFDLASSSSSFVKMSTVAKSAEQLTYMYNHHPSGIT
jgi:hypothetical protein